MEQQLDFMGRDKNDMDMTTLQIRLPTEHKRDLFVKARQDGFSSASAVIKLLIKAYITRVQGLQDPRPLSTINDSANQIVELTPLFKRYPKMQKI